MIKGRRILGAFLGVALAASVAAGCKGSAASDGESGGAGGGTGGAASGPSVLQIAAGADAGDAVTSIDQMLVVADLMFKFDPDLHPDATASSNSNTIKQNATNQTAGCANVKLTQGVGLTIDFGAAPGCMLSGGAVVSGSLVVSVSKADATSTLTVDLTFTDLVVNGVTVNGTASFATTTGSTFDVATMLTLQNGTKPPSDVNGTLSVTGSPGSISVSGMVTTSAGPTTLTNVILEHGACYSSGGSVAVTNTTLGNPTLTFDMSTPSTGKAQLVVSTPQGKALPATTITLPAYGTCPHA